MESKMQGEPDTCNDRAANARFEAIAGQVADALAGPGWLAVEDALPRPLVGALVERARALASIGSLSPASVGRAASRRHAESVRGDRTAWLDRANGDVAEDALLDRLDRWRASLNRALFLGLVDVEAHFALYPPGAYYAAHRDRFRDDDRRVVSAVFYLNDGWRDDDGGALVLHLVDGARRVVPEAGRGVFFRSELLHEVEPATRERYSVAAWFRRR